MEVKSSLESVKRGLEKFPVQGMSMSEDSEVKITVNDEYKLSEEDIMFLQSLSDLILVSVASDSLGNLARVIKVGAALGVMGGFE